MAEIIDKEIFVCYAHDVMSRERKGGFIRGFNVFLPKRQTLTIEEEENRKLELKAECNTIINKPDFGEKDFDCFVENMVRLINQNEDQGRLYGKTEKLDIDLISEGYQGNKGKKYRKIVIHKGDGHSGDREIRESVYYRQTNNNGGEVAPYLNASVRIPSTEITITYSSDVIEISKSVSLVIKPDSRHNVLDISLTSEQTQAFCRKVYDIYSESTPGWPGPPTQNT